MSEVLGEGHFQVKAGDSLRAMASEAYADDPSGSSDVNPGSVSRQDGVPEDLSDQRAAPEANMGPSICVDVLYVMKKRGGRGENAAEYGIFCS